MLNQELFAEFNLLLRYPLSSSQRGLKIHSDAEPSVIEAARRLFDKGLVSQSDGGYLTERGHLAASQLQNAASLLNTHATP